MSIMTSLQNLEDDLDEISRGEKELGPRDACVLETVQ